MNDRVVAQLCFHAAVMMFCAFVSGMMIGLVGVGQIEGSVADWKVAHMEPLINSIVLLAVAGFINTVISTPVKAKVVAYCLIVMGYCNTVFGFMRGATGALGYEFDDALANNITALAGIVGVPLAIVAFGIILVEAYRKSRPS